MKSRPTRTSCMMFLMRGFWRTVTCSTAWDRDDVWLAAVGSCILCLFPFSSSCMTCGAARGREGDGGRVERGTQPVALPPSPSSTQLHVAASHLRWAPLQHMQPVSLDVRSPPPPSLLRRVSARPTSALTVPLGFVAPFAACHFSTAPGEGRAVGPRRDSALTGLGGGDGRAGHSWPTARPRLLQTQLRWPGTQAGGESLGSYARGQERLCVGGAGDKGSCRIKSRAGVCAPRSPPWR